MMHKKSIKYRIGVGIMSLGLLSVISAIALMGYNIWDDQRAADAASYRASLLRTEIDNNLLHLQQSGAGKSSDSIVETTRSTPSNINIDGESYIGILNIPQFDIELPVYSTWSYNKLKNAPCRYTGEIYDENLVIAAHNYKHHFGSISTLSYGDQITLSDGDGTLHIYEVIEINTVNPTDVSEVVTSDYDLTLLTCTYGGKTRVIVRCNRVPQIIGRDKNAIA